MLDKNLAAWDIPVSEEFLARVHRGVRRRRLLRAAVTGGAALTVAAVAAVTVAVTGSAGPVRQDTPPAASSSPDGAVLDGFRLTHLPDGAVRVGPDSTYTAAVTEQGLRNDGPPPTPGQPRASVVMRRFDRGVGIGLFVTVLRPEPGTDPATGADRIGDWLVRWAVGRATPVRTFDVPVGDARLVAHVGSETTTQAVVVTTPDHVVITVEGNSAFSAAEMEAVARGITS